MTKHTLLLIKDIVTEIEFANSNLVDMLDFLNITDDERKRIEDAIIVTREKTDAIRRTQISQLDEHIDVNYIETTYKY